MAKTDLGSMSKSDLEKLKGEVEQALASLVQRRKAEAKKAAEDAAKKFGYSLGDLVGKERGKKGASPAKYRNPANPSQTWSGRGRQPGWIKEGLAKGKKLSEFAI
ncbi:MAG: H-NS histone family protein [Paracoccaceae bacterium]|nr:H-NS histone family protein [Paracoccaceae bacterium]